MGGNTNVKKVHLVNWIIIIGGPPHICSWYTSMTSNQMVFYYARNRLIYSHDINSYYHWFVLKALGNTVVSLINALPELHKIKMPCQSTMKTWICCTHEMCIICFYIIYFWHGSTVYYSWPCLFTAEHGYTHLRKIFYIREISLFELQVFLWLLCS